MKRKTLTAGGLVLALGFGITTLTAMAAELPKNVSFSTLVTTPFAIEGLTGDNAANLYTTGRGADPCPVWRINLANPSLVVVGNVAAPCSPSGIAFNDAGDLFLADGSTVLTLTPNSATPPTAVPYATGVPGTNGLAFDKHGNLWTGDGTTGQGRVWKIGPGGGDCTPGAEVNCEEVFRIQPMRNSTALGGEIAGDGVGRQARTFPPGTLANAMGGQDLVANGLGFNRQGTLFVVDTARGAIWKIEFDSEGNLRSPTGCDKTFTDNTLCLTNVLVAHPLLEGADGFVLDQAGNFWVDANERNAVVAVTANNEVVEIFRNQPDATTHLRNAGPLETPTSPFISGQTFCTSNSDGNRRDNSPNTEGEIGGAGQDRGKISCMEPDLNIPGMLLPVSN